MVHYTKNLFTCVDSVSDAIIIVGSNIKNTAFIREFEKKIKDDFFLPNEDQIKIIHSVKNPLKTLIELSRRREAIVLVKHLIEIFCDRITIEDDELLMNALKNPTNNSLTYVILFEYCFIDVPLRQNLLNRLTKVWNIWEEQGLKSYHIKIWQNFYPDQRHYFTEIWNVVEKFAEKRYPVKNLFDVQYQKLLQLIKLKENIVNCINTYCLKCSDKEKYLEFLQLMQQQIDDGVMRNFVIQPELKELEPIITHLSHISQSNAWMHYYKRKTKSQNSMTMFNLILFIFVFFIDQKRNDDEEENDNESLNIDLLFNDNKGKNGNNDFSEDCKILIMKKNE